MIVVDSRDVKPVVNPEGDPMVAKGPVYIRRLSDDKIWEGTGALLVTFNPGSKLSFHTHSSEQVLFVTEGKGILATRDKEYVVTPGMIIFIPAGEDHYHGATEDSSFTHLAFYKGETKVTS
jgi:quercetin dioxygenase-like cupin family protein